MGVNAPSGDDAVDWFSTVGSANPTTLPFRFVDNAKAILRRGALVRAII
jgi:hypothetical protein